MFKYVILIFNRVNQHEYNKIRDISLTLFNFSFSFLFIFYSLNLFYLICFSQAASVVWLDPNAFFCLF